MVRFAVSSMFFHEYTTAEIFDFVGESGLDTLEFWLETPHFWLRDLPAGELHSCISSHPRFIPITVHAPVLDLNPCSINPGIAALSVKSAVSAIMCAEEAGAAVITLHPGKRTARRSPSGADFERFEHYIRVLGEASAGKSVKVAMENMERKVNSLLCTPEDVRELLDREPWLYFTLDVSHAMGTSTEEVHTYIDLCHDRLANVHISRAEDGRMHLPPGGNADIAGILRHLDESGYTGTLTLEMEDMNFSHVLTSEEKIVILMEQLAFMKKYIV
jgi:Sugar phosphate isomerases/epimerases